MNTKFEDGALKVTEMKNGDLPAYIRQFEAIVKCFKPDEESKISLFRNGLDSKYYALLAGQKFETYPEMKTVAVACFERSSNENAMSLSIFKAKRENVGDLPSHWDKNKRQSYQERRCFHCGKVGHKAYWCPGKTAITPPREPLNSNGQH